MWTCWSWSRDIIYIHMRKPMIHKYTVSVCTPSDVVQLQSHSQMSACVDKVRTWASCNRLLLNLNTVKTEVLWCSTSRRQHQIPQSRTRIGHDFATTTATSVRDLGIQTNSNVSISHTFRERCWLALLCFTIHGIGYIAGQQSSSRMGVPLYAGPSVWKFAARWTLKFRQLWRF